MPTSPTPMMATFVMGRICCPASPKICVCRSYVALVAEPYPGEFRFDPETRQWHFNDKLLLGLFDAAGRDEARLREKERLFFWHEYVHLGQGLTSDTYAILRQLDFLSRQPGGPLDDETHRTVLRAQIGGALRSMWAFEEPAPLSVLQERRLRRYLNWYWRHVQLRDAPSLRSALETLRSSRVLKSQDSNGGSPGPAYSWSSRIEGVSVGCTLESSARTAAWCAGASPRMPASRACWRRPPNTTPRRSSASSAHWPRTPTSRPV